MIEVVLSLFLFLVAYVITHVSFNTFLYGTKGVDRKKGLWRFVLTVLLSYLVIILTVALISKLQAVPVLGIVFKLIDIILEMFVGYIGIYWLYIGIYVSYGFIIAFLYYTFKGKREVRQAKLSFESYLAEQKKREAEEESKRFEKILSMETQEGDSAEETEEEEDVVTLQEDPFDVVEQESSWLDGLSVTLSNAHDIPTLQKATAEALAGHLMFGREGSRYFVISTAQNLQALKQLFSQNAVDTASLVATPAIVFFDSEKAEVHDLKTYIGGLQ